MTREEAIRWLTDSHNRTKFLGGPYYLLTPEEADRIAFLLADVADLIDAWEPQDEL